MAIFAYIKMQYNTSYIVAFDGTGNAADIDRDYVTGDLVTAPPENPDNYLIITGTQGTTLSVAAVATDTTITVADPTGIVKGQKIVILLDVAQPYGTHMYNTVKSIAGSVITLARPMDAAAGIGKQVATSAQLAGTQTIGVNFSYARDYKNSKALSIQGRTEDIRKGQFFYEGAGRWFSAESQELADVNAALSSYKDASKYTVSDVDGHGYTFTSNADAAALVDLSKDYNSKVEQGQDALLDQIRDAANTSAVDDISDNRGFPVPVDSGTDFPPVRFINDSEQIISIYADTTTALQLTRYYDESNVLQGLMGFAHLTDDLVFTSVNGGFDVNAQGGDVDIDATAGSVDIFADTNLVFTADTGTTTFNANDGNFIINAAANTVDINCGVFDLDGNGAITLSTSAGDITLEPGSDVVLNTDNIDFNANTDSSFQTLRFNDDLGATRGFVAFNHAVDSTVVQSAVEVAINSTSTGNDRINIATPGTNADMPFLFRATGANGGAFRIGTGTLTPVSIVTANGGDLYVQDSGVTSGLYLKNSDADANNWLKVSANPSSIIEVYTDSDLPDVAGVVTVSSDTTFVLKANAPITTSKRFVLTGASTDVNFTGMDTGNALIYTGTGTFITANGINGIRIQSSISIVGNAAATCFDIKRITQNVIIKRTNFANWGNMGTIQRLNIIDIESITLTGTDEPLIIDDVAFISMRSVAMQNSVTSSNPFVRILNTRKAIPTTGGMLGVGTELQSGESAVYISPDLFMNVVNSNFSFIAGIIGGANKNLFETGATGSITIISDATLGARTLTAMADATEESTTVTTSAAHNYYEGETITITGTTNYNGTWKIQSIPTTTSFVIPVAFVADDATGTSNNPRMTVTSAGHGLSELDVVKILTDTATNGYDMGYTIFNVLAGSFDISQTFVATDTGTWDTSSLNERDPAVLVDSTQGVPSSKTIASGGVSDNTDTTTVASGTYGAISLSTAFAPDSTTERFKLIDPDGGIWEYTGFDDTTLELFVSFRILKSGGSQDYDFNVAINGTVGSTVHMTATVQTTARNVVALYPVSVSNGDSVALQISGVGTTDSVTFSEMQMNIK